ncbi:hypothetical protein scyTo_0014994 [Scyliorhinus torazame]|uniref:RIIa domain-containing protein n=1 Tax=Scyliorhinus torazame TaxID=75743 RepID=A0A401NZU2_SCYTO|nr:hypothetical protein [Scyliorhinus torazame]
MNIEIPPGLTDLLQGYTVEVLRHRPSDLVEFAIQYFTELKEKEAGGRGRFRTDDHLMQTESNGEEDESESDSGSEFEERHPIWLHHSLLSISLSMSLASVKIDV